jgi:hypothetical protein
VAHDTGPWIIERLIVSGIGLAVLAVVDMTALLASYRTLRVMRIPPRWPTLLIGYGLSTLMLWGLWLALLDPFYQSRYIAWSSLSGFLSFVVSVFAVAEWPVRGWYVGTKSWMWVWIVRPTRHFFLYLRDHHAFFGWLTLLAATIHTVLIFPALSRVSSYEVWTGVVALLLLAILTATGEWIARATGTKRLAPAARWWHLALTFAFIVAFAFHV